MCGARVEPERQDRLSFAGLERQYMVLQIGVQAANWNAVRRALEEGLGQAGGPAAIFSSKTKDQMEASCVGVLATMCCTRSTRGMGGQQRSVGTSSPRPCMAHPSLQFQVRLNWNEIKQETQTDGYAWGLWQSP